MKKIQRGLAVTMAAAFLLSTTMATTAMATANQDLGTQTAKTDKAVKVKDKDNAKNNDNGNAMRKTKNNDKAKDKEASKIAKHIF